MTTTLVLVRHAAHVQLGKLLSGRAGSVPLSNAGRAQARQLARSLRDIPFVAVHTSPVQRARETAEAIASGLVEVEEVDALNEVDFGEWTGRDFDALETDPAWRVWNIERGTARTPGGESMREAQARAVNHVEQVARTYEGQQVAMVSHCDIIRSVVAHYLGLSLDKLLQFDIDPASVSTLAVGSWGGRVLRLNGEMQ